MSGRRRHRAAGAGGAVSSTRKFPRAHSMLVQTHCNVWQPLVGVFRRCLSRSKRDDVEKLHGAGTRNPPQPTTTRARSTQHSSTRLMTAPSRARSTRVHPPSHHTIPLLRMRQPRPQPMAYPGGRWRLLTHRPCPRPSLPSPSPSSSASASSSAASSLSSSPRSTTIFGTRAGSTSPAPGACE